MEHRAATRPRERSVLPIIFLPPDENALVDPIGLSCPPAQGPPPTRRRPDRSADMSSPRMRPRTQRRTPNTEDPSRMGRSTRSRISITFIKRSANRAALGASLPRGG